MTDQEFRAEFIRRQQRAEARRQRSPAEQIRDEMRGYRDGLLDGAREAAATSRKQRKLAALIAPGSGATDGERAAAQAALDRLRSDLR